MTETPLETALEQEVDRTIQRLCAVCSEIFYDKLRQRGEHLAYEWYLVISEPLGEVMYGAGDLSRMLAATPDALPKRLQHFLGRCLYGSGHHIYLHFSRVLEQLNTGQPEPEQPTEPRPDEPSRQRDSSLDGIPVTVLRDETIAALDGYLDACDAHRARLEQSGHKQFAEWMRVPTELIIEVKKMIGLAANVLDAASDNVPKAMRELVTYGLLIAAPRLRRLLKQVESEIDAVFPELEAPDDEDEEDDSSQRNL